MKNKQFKKSHKKPAKLQKLKYPYTKRRLENKYANQKRAIKSFLRKGSHNNKRPDYVVKIMGLIVAIIFVFLFFGLFINEFYHKQTFNHTVWLPCFFGCCCLVFQILYFQKHHKLPSLDEKIINRQTTWAKVQIVLLNLFMIGVVAVMFGFPSNTLITQIMGQHQPPKVYTISKKNVSSNRYGTDYELYVVNDDNPNDKRQLDFSLGFFNRVKIGDYLIVHDTCSPVSCYVAENDIVIIDKVYPRVKNEDGFL